MPTTRRPVGAISRVIRSWPLVTVVVVAMATLFATMGHDSLAASSRAVLHGLCAQRPSHSFAVGGNLLPFDARMTGIYAGSLASWIALAVRGRLLAAATPPRTVIALLAAGVVALALDGTNALLVDVAVWHPWEPLHETRFFTGFATGVALATLEVWLIATSLPRLARLEPAWSGARDFWWACLVAVGAYALIRADLAWTYPEIVVGLLASAWLTVTGLALVIVIAGFGLERRIGSARHLDVPVAVGAIVAIAIIVGLAQLRFWLERTLGIPQDFVAAVKGTLATILR